MRSFLSKTAAILLSVSFALAWNPTTAEAVKKRPPTLTVEWDLQATDDRGRRTQCQGDEDICSVSYALILRRGSLQVGNLYSGKVDMPSFIIDSWGACTGKNKKRGILCGTMNHDCGDGCYADVLAVRVKKGTVFVDKYEGCRGGEECYEKPKTVFSQNLGNVKLKPRK